MEKDKIFASGKRYIPGGVKELMIKSAKGVKLFDEDDREYIDFDLGGGSLILGHSNETVVKALTCALQDDICLFENSFAEVEISKFLCENIDYIDMVKVHNSKTNAIKAAINMGRTYTKKEKILTFKSSEEKNPSLNYISCNLNDENELLSKFNKYGKEIAVAIIEPVSIEDGIKCCNEKFLKLLRTLCNKNGVVLIFDEYVSSFRTSFKGVRGETDVLPDLVVFGKVLNCGMAGAYLGGKRKIMDRQYDDKQNSINTLSIVGGIAILNRLFAHPEYHQQIESVSKKLEDGLNKIKNKYNGEFCVKRASGMVQIEIESKLYKKYYYFMLEKGFNIPKSNDKPLFICSEHNITHVFKFLKSFEEFLINEIVK